MKVRRIVLVILSVLFGCFYMMPQTVLAKVNDKACSQITDEELKSAMGCDASGKTVQPVAVDLVNAAISVTGIIAVIVIIIAGVKLITSSGDPAKVTQAKRVIIYALVGLGVAVFAWVIVTFVLNNFASE